MSYFTTLVTLALSALTVVATPTSGLVEVGARAYYCPDVQVYFARGTTEVPTLGTVIGPGFSAALSLQLVGKSVEFTGISYPALVSGYLAGGDTGGAKTMANSATSTANNCPNTKIVLSGYSQGAQVTHLAARQLVVAVVTFGDPYESTALPGVLQSRRKTCCNFGDLICAGLPTILAPHLTYGTVRCVCSVSI
ncbi:cutinase [Ephemerocybe angulata]|uniref:Cutinase n=1 Tax=Ephemerocybe angulata TaxID=980116 RepID=A0A8H6I843_9AGAR|nr:cutinase [Tulosesus angulatus]